MRISYTLPFGQPWFPRVLFTLFVVVGPVYDRWSRGRVHWVYKWVSVPVFLANPLRIVVGNTESWHAFAKLLVR